MSERDFVMARLAAARSSAACAIDALDSAVLLFVDPEEDAKGKTRLECLEGALDLLGEAARSVEAAQELFAEVDPAEGEPELHGDGDEDGEEQ